MSTDATAREGVRWRTSSYTNGGADAECVEIGVPVAGDDDRRLVGDTKNRGPALIFPPGAFRAFVEGLKRG
ncbi:MULTISPECIES: DUF397 domain-containing protein [Saccharothrix]|uniref:DUF397 domain-containing protein n=1 Tax=Saccharothrix TaxID=2071 RepID=UPI00093E32C8|nr:DUF397 domain-containing protein [Saccharothrix sp. CB00851]